jgi:hypothetical protein
MIITGLRMPTLHIPEQMAQRAGCAADVDLIQGSSVKAILDEAVCREPSLSQWIYATPKALHTYLRVFVDGRLCVSDPLATPVRPESQVWLVTALVGG